MPSEELLAIPGIGPTSAQALSDAGFDSLAALETATVEDLVAVPGFGPSRARTLLSRIDKRADAREEAILKLTAKRKLAKFEAKKARKKAKSAKSKKKRAKWKAAAGKLDRKAKKLAARIEALKGE